MDACLQLLLDLTGKAFLVFLGALLGFAFSFCQWKANLRHVELERRREKLQLLHELLLQYAELVRYVIHKRNNPNHYYPDPGPNPWPQMLALRSHYAPEVPKAAFDELLELYGQTVERVPQPPFSAFDPILIKVKEICQQINVKIETLD